MVQASNEFDSLSGLPQNIAPRLLGCLLVRQLDGPGAARPTQLVGRIVETEAYGQADAASHSFKGQTARTAVMFGPPGKLYVYFTYGMHYCCNIVTGPEGHGSAVLIRAIEPLEGQAVMADNRHIGTKPSSQLTNGPAKLCQAFGIDLSLNGHDLQQAPLMLQFRPPLPAEQVVQTTRVGISQAKDVAWRFYMKGNPYVSKL